MISPVRTAGGRLVALLLAGLLAAPPCAFADELAAVPEKPVEGGRLSGRILGADGETPVAGAVVRLQYLDGDRVVAGEATDRKGRFEIEGLPHGYADLVVETGAESFLGDRVVALPPSGRVTVRVALARPGDRSEAWWAAKGGLEIPGGRGTAAGLAEIDPSVRGRDFWKSRAGIAVLATIGGALLLAITLGGRDTPSGTTSVP